MTTIKNRRLGSRGEAKKVPPRQPESRANSFVTARRERPASNSISKFSLAHRDAHISRSALLSNPSRLASLVGPTAVRLLRYRHAIIDSPRPARRIFPAPHDSADPASRLDADDNETHRGMCSSLVSSRCAPRTVINAKMTKRENGK